MQEALQNGIYENIKKEFNKIPSKTWFSEERKKETLKRIKEHVGEFPSYELPKNFKAHTGILTAEKVDRIIGHYIGNPFYPLWEITRIT